MNRKVIIATKNKGKAKEFSSLLSEYGIEVITLLDIEHAPDIAETGQTFEENAILKAEGIAAYTNHFVIADDSGLIIDELDGMPGIFSARYAGEQKNDEANIEKVLHEMKDVPKGKRTARFYCALALAGPDIKTEVVHGTCEGTILFERQGDGGFGYDPIFCVSSLNQSMAELSASEKNRISHRREALNNLKSIVEKHFGGSD